MLFLLTNCIAGFTQTKFAPLGAEWNYCKPNDSGNPLYSYKKYVADRDTVVDGKTGRLIKSHDFTEVMVEENNKVYYHFKNKFRLIYDFGVTKGDTVAFDFKSYSSNSLLIDTIYHINCVVEQIDTVLVNNKKLRKISTSVIPIDNLTHIVWPARYDYLEKVGYEYDFMFILPIPSVGYMHNLRCYNDVDISYITEWWKGQNRACDFSLLTSVPIIAENNAQLDQNIPNPFSKETRIGCFIPEGSGNSVLYIYNMNGTQLKQYNINGLGKQSVTINGSSFEPGMYLYTLVIDGKEVDTKRMILTK